MALELLVSQTITGELEPVISDPTGELGPVIKRSNKMPDLYH